MQVGQNLGLPQEEIATHQFDCDELAIVAWWRDGVGGGC
jgi:hypothetical protein